MIVDDIKENTFLLEKFLTKYGAEVITACDGEDAWNKFHDSQGIHTIITDLRMPKMSGQEFMGKVREYEKITRNQNIPIIVLTGESDPEERSLCMSKYGVNEYLLKPVQLTDLIDSLIRVAHKPRIKKLHIFIIDDDPLSSYFIQKVYTDYGHPLTRCKSNFEVFFRFTQTEKG